MAIKLSAPPKILFRAPNWLGDALMAAPAVESVRARFGEAFIGLAIRENISGLGRIMAAVDKVHPISNSSWARRQSILDTARIGYEALVIFPNSFRSAWEFRLTGIPYRAGYSSLSRSFILTHAVPRPAKHSMNQADYFNALVEALFPDLTRVKPIFNMPDEAVENSLTLLPDDGGPWAGVGFGATYGSAKMWPPERFAALIDRLAPHATVALFGAQSETGMAERIAGLARSRPVSLVGRTDIPTLAATLKRLRVYVTNDTGPMHLAAAMGTPVVAIFGPTDPGETAPDMAAGKILYHKAECAPCWKRVCPIDHRCMTAIGVAEAAAAALKFLRPEA